MYGVMFKIAVCDDKKEACSIIENALLCYASDNDFALDVEVFYSAIEMFSHLKQGSSYDLIFLDIEIPGMTGVELGDNIRNYMEDYHTKIVFVSATEMYYRELFEVQPMHFLLKPITKQDVIKDLKLALKLCGIEDAKFEYTVAKEQFKISFNEILHIVSEGRRMVLTTSDDVVKFYSTTDDVFAKVKKHRFIRIHRAFIVNYNYITRISSDSVTMSDGVELAIGRAYKEEFRRLVSIYEREMLA